MLPPGDMGQRRETSVGEDLDLYGGTQKGQGIECDHSEAKGWSWQHSSSWKGSSTGAKLTCSVVVG